MTDQFDPGYRMLVVACKSDKRWFDLDAVRTDYKPGQSGAATRVHYDPRVGGGRSRVGSTGKSYLDGAGAPPLDYWLIDTQAGVDRVLKSMLPEKVCKICGEPSRRIVEQTNEEYKEVRKQVDRDFQRAAGPASGSGRANSGYTKNNKAGSLLGNGVVRPEYTTLGWTDCKHNDWRAGVVLDPFDLTTEGTNMGEARYIIGDVFDALATLEPNSVDLVFSSPPFLALRSYLPADHEMKAKEIGSEATPADFLDTLLDVVEACDRVLAPHGSLVFELGDTFAGSGGAGGDYAEGGLHDGQPLFKQKNNRFNQPDGETRTGPGRTTTGHPGWPLPKSLCGIPTLFAWSLAYGRNLLRPERETPRWRIRNLIVWARPNPPVGALGDKFRPATSYLTVACKSDKRWFDLDSVRSDTPRTERPRNRQDEDAMQRDGQWSTFPNVEMQGGAPPLDYWEIPTQPFRGAHYATFPTALVVKPVASMCPAKVCRVCGEPSRRIAETTNALGYAVQRTAHVVTPDGAGDGRVGVEDINKAAPDCAERVTLGWTDCGHNDWRNGVVLDVFAGSGTTLAVATGHGRDAIGIDLDARNFELARERVGPMFLPEPEFVGEPFQFPKVEDVQTDAEVL